MRLPLGALIATVALTAGQFAALPHAEAARPTLDLDDALTRMSAPQGVLHHEDVSISAETGVASLRGDRGTLRMRAGSGGGKRQVDGVTLSNADGGSVTVQSTVDGGLRALITIDSPTAPTEYRFPIAGDVVSLEMGAEGAVVALGEGGVPIAIAEAPWAVDANGVSVPTHFEVRGPELVQVVEHRDGRYAYGIVADPWWNPFSWNWGKINSTIKKGAKKTWKVSVCASSIALAVYPGAKAWKFVKELGGIREAARLFVGAGSVADAKKLVPGLAAEILGINGIKSACF